MMEAKTEYETFDGLAYRQMRLFVWELTPEQEKKYNKELKLNPLRAKVSEASEKDIEALVNIYNRSWLTSNTPFSRINAETMKSRQDNYMKVIVCTKYGKLEDSL